MSLPPVSRSCVSAPSARTSSSFEPSSVRARSSFDVQGPKQEPGAALRRLLATDGFDSPVDAKKAGQVGQLDEVERMLTRLAQVLARSVSLLGGDAGPGLPTTGGSAPLSSGARGGPPAQRAPVGETKAVGAAGAPAAPVAQAAPPAQGAPVGEAKAVGAPGGPAKSGNTMTFSNDGTKPMNIQFTPNAGEKPVDAVTLAPGEKRMVEFPQGWSGNFRSTSGDGSAATLGEVKFNGGSNQTYYDVSYIEGHNASMTIQPQSGGRKSGTLDNLVASAPDSIKAKDASGTAYGIKNTTTSNVQDGQVVDYFRK